MLTRLASRSGYGALGPGRGFRTSSGISMAICQCSYPQPDRDACTMLATPSDNGEAQHANSAEPAHAC